MAKTQETTLEIPSLRRRAHLVPDSYRAEDNTVEVTFSTGEETVEFTPFPEPFIERLSFEEGHIDWSRLKSGAAPVLNTHQDWEIGKQVGVIEDAWVLTVSDVPGQSDARARLRLSKRDSIAELRQDVADGIVQNVSVRYKVFRYRDVTGPDDHLPIKLAVLWQPIEISFVPIGEDSGARTRSQEDKFYTCTIESDHEDTSMAQSKKREKKDPNQGGTGAEAQAERKRGLDIRRAVKLAGLEDGYADELIAIEEEGVAITIERAHSMIFDKMSTADPDDGGDGGDAGGDGGDGGEEPAAPSDSPAQVERARGLAVRQAVDLAGLDASYADELIGMNNRGGNPLSVDKCRSMIFDRLAEEADTEGMQNGHKVTVGSDGFERARSGMQNALEHKCSVLGDDGKEVELTEHGRDFSGMSICRMAEEYFTLAGQGEHVRGLSNDAMAEFTFSRSRAFAAPHGSTDFPKLLANVGEKKLRRAYAASPSSWKEIATRNSASDFKSMSRPALGEHPQLTQVAPGAEYKIGTLGEEGETYAILKYGKILSFTREAMVNDDLSAFNRLPMLAGRAAQELENDLAWAIITNNANMADGNALFSVAHNNDGSGVLSGDDIGIASLSSGRDSMRQQVGINGQRIGVAPAFLIVPSALETNAQKLTAQVMPNAAGGVNPFASAFQNVLVEPRLDADSTIKWYLSASPSQIDVLEYSFLQGNDGPSLFTREGFNIDGMEMKVRHEFGIAVLDHRGLYRSSGA